MKFTRVIFNTYSFFLESAAKAKWTPAFLMFKNSLLLPCCVNYCVNMKDIFSTNAPLKIYLSLKLATRSLGDNLALSFLLLIYNPMPDLHLIVKGNSKIQGK